MALPTSPAVVVLENDQSIYTPNIQSSVVGIVGFADKGPTNKATLVTSQTDLLNKFGKPSSDIPGQGLEGTLEILEATDQIYFVRAAGSDSLNATVSSLLGFCPAVIVSGSTVTTSPTSIIYSITDNAGVVQVDSQVVSLASSTGITSMSSILTNYFNPSLVNDNDLMALHYDGLSFLVAKYAGSNARLSVSTPSVATFGFSSIDASGLALTGGNNITASGGIAIGANGLQVRFSSNYPGTGYNLETLRDGSIKGVSIEIENKSPLRDNVVVNSEGSARESFLVNLSPSAETSIEYLLVNDETNNSSDYVYSEVIKGSTVYTMPNEFADQLAVTATWNYSGTTVTGIPRFVKLVEGTYGLAGGDSGYSTTEEGDSADRTALIGSSADKSGLYALDDDSLNISIATIPGITNQSVQNALITLAETSKNFVAVVAPPYGLDSTQEAVEWMNGKGTRTSPINNSYAAVYWPWVQTFNFYAGADEWYDPATFAVRQMVFTDAVAEPWFAPAGFRRGRLTKPTDVEVVLNQGDRNVLYDNNINPVSKEIQDGITIMGQKTAQRLPTALDRVNVRRLMIFIRKTLLQLGKPFQFEPSDPLTWELVEDALRPFIDDLLARRAILEGDVKCDFTTNTPLRRDRNELWCAVTIKPTKAAETIVFEVNLTNQSATING